MMARANADILVEQAKRDNTFQLALRNGISQDVGEVLKKEASILSDSVQGQISRAVAAKLFNRLQDMFYIGDE